MNQGYKDKLILAEQYQRQGSLLKTAAYFGVSKKLIWNFMKKFDIPRNTPKALLPKKEKPIDTFHKGFIITASGYKLLRKEEHPNANSKGYVREHILVMEKHLGRYLTDNEVVHHIDRNKLNNDIGNLQLMTKYEHKRLHSGEDRKTVDLQYAKSLLDKGYTMEQVSKYLKISQTGLRKKFHKAGIETNLKRGSARRKNLEDL